MPKHIKDGFRRPGILKRFLASWKKSQEKKKKKKKKKKAQEVIQTFIVVVMTASLSCINLLKLKTLLRKKKLRNQIRKKEKKRITYS